MGVIQLRSPLILLLVMAALLVGCDPPSEEADPERPISVTLLTTPARVGPAAIEVRVKQLDQPVSGATIEVVGDMTHAGMVPIVTTQAAEASPGVYISEGFEFDMVGDWVITATVAFPDGAVRRGTLTLSVRR
jgi:hypothetical protein